MILNDFSCPECGELTEKLVPTNTHKITCFCGATASKIMGMPTVKLEGLTGDFPSAHSNWARIREEKARSKY